MRSWAPCANHVRTVLMLLLALAFPVSGSAVETVEVKVIHDQRFPALSEAEVSEVLRAAEVLCQQKLQRDVTFEVKVSVPWREFHDMQWATVAPYEPASLLSGNSKAKAEIQSTAQRLFNSAQGNERGAELFRALGVGTADEFAAFYLARAGEIQRRLTSPDHPTGWKRHCYSRWEAMMAVSSETDVPQLWLTNAMLIEDLPTATPFTFSTAILLGAAMPCDQTPTATASYGGILTDDAELMGHRLGKLTREDKLACIAYLIAHEVGVHLLLEKADLNAEDGGLALQLSAASSLEHIKRPSQTPHVADLACTTIQFHRRIMRMRVHAAQGHQKAAADEFFEIIALDIPPAWIESASAEYERLFPSK